MTLLLLVRHALTDATGKRLSGRAPGLHLSDEGRRQAAAVAERLAAVPIAAVYTSPLERCVETAEAVAQRRALPVQAQEELVEIGYGRWTGRSFGQLTRTELWKRIQQAPSTIRFPDGETLVEAQHRAVTVLDAIAARHPRRIVTAVSHADVIRLALAHYLGVHIDLFQRIVVSPVSVSAVLIGDRVPRIIRVNDTGSLADLVSRSTRRRRAPAEGGRPAGASPGPGPGRPGLGRSPIG